MLFFDFLLTQTDVITCNRKSEGNLMCKFGYQNKYYDSLKGREFYDRNNFWEKNWHMPLE